VSRSLNENGDNSLPLPLSPLTLFRPSKQKPNKRTQVYRGILIFGINILDVIRRKLETQCH